MKTLGFLTLFILMIPIVSYSRSETSKHLTMNQINATLDKSAIKYLALAKVTPDSLYPRTVLNGSVKLVGREDWTSGFFPASLWYLYDYTGIKEIAKQAERITRTLEPLKEFKHTHDLGFMIYCPFGNAYNITGDTYYRDVFIKTAQTLAIRYNKNTKCLRSWDEKKWQFPVIIDNMMNLELMLEAYKINNDSNLYTVSVNHANTTLKNHFRADYSSYHLVDYDTITGMVKIKQTVQGFSDSSSWARGQSWAFYGYTTMFHETKDSVYLKQAINIANFIMNNPNMPKDGVTFWDFNDAAIPNSPRDVAAAAIFASGLMELSKYAKQPEKYISFAENILISLSSDAYFNKDDENNGFLLKHATGHKPNNSEIDVPLNYADYYFIEALLRFKNQLK